MSCPPTAHSDRRAHALLDRVQNDRFSSELSGHGMHPERERGYRDGWNACSEHVEHLVRLFLTEQRLMAAIDEMRNAREIDLRVKYELTGELP